VTGEGHKCCALESQRYGKSRSCDADRFTGETTGREEWNAVATPSRVRMLAAMLRWEMGELLSIVKSG